MATITINRVSSFPTTFAPLTATSRADYLRGDGANNVIARPLSILEQEIFDQLTALGASPFEIYQAIFTGAITRPLSALEVENYPFLFDPAVALQFGFNVPTSLTGALDLLVAITGSGSFDSGPEPDNSGFGGNDRIFGRGGDDLIIDLAGNNLIVTDDGDDMILLGAGNDQIYDRGGDNLITILGGNNYVLTRHGDDNVTTGDGDDVVNVFNGRNEVNAGEGDNRVRGGDGLDIVNVGTGDDFVEIRNGTLGQTESYDLGFIGVFGFEAHNFVRDEGGSDTIRATGNSRNDQPGIEDQVFNGDDLILSDLGSVFGDDDIFAGSGNNIIVDAGGNDTIGTLEGNDIIFTSFLVAGDDTISSGAGSDTINPGSGSDEIRAGAGADFIDLESDGFVDTLIFRQGDQSTLASETDIVSGFEAGIDRIDVSALGLTIDDLFVFDAAAAGISAGDENIGDTLLAWDASGDGAIGAGDLFTNILADFGGGLTGDNFVFAEDLIA